jgi:hypothetical protein
MLRSTSQRLFQQAGRCASATTTTSTNSTAASSVPAMVGGGSSNRRLFSSMMSVRDALNTAMSEEMTRDENVSI